LSRGSRLARTNSALERPHIGVLRIVDVGYIEEEVDLAFLWHRNTELGVFDPAQPEPGNASDIGYPPVSW
jgi:hypothetical protein